LAEFKIDLEGFPVVGVWVAVQLNLTRIQTEHFREQQVHLPFVVLVWGVKSLAVFVCAFVESEIFAKVKPVVGRPGIVKCVVWGRAVVRLESVGRHLEFEVILQIRHFVEIKIKDPKSYVEPDLAFSYTFVSLKLVVEVKLICRVMESRFSFGHNNAKVRSVCKRDNSN
jgi:hypothetical protein